MRVIVLIGGREAIPVRAIPLLTDWETMSPHVVARALAGGKVSVGFPRLQAFRRTGDSERPVSATWWKRNACRKRKLKAVSNSMKGVEVNMTAASTPGPIEISTGIDDMTSR